MKKGFNFKVDGADYSANSIATVFNYNEKLNNFLSVSEDGLSSDKKLTPDQKNALDKLCNTFDDRDIWKHIRAFYPLLGNTYQQLNANLKDSDLYPLLINRGSINRGWNQDNIQGFHWVDGLTVDLGVGGADTENLGLSIYERTGAADAVFRVLCQCETIDDVVSHIQTKGYNTNILGGGIASSTIVAGQTGYQRENTNSPAGLCSVFRGAEKSQRFYQNEVVYTSVINPSLDAKNKSTQRIMIGSRSYPTNSYVSCFGILKNMPDNIYREYADAVLTFLQESGLK